MNAALSILIDRSLLTNTVIEVSKKLADLARISDSNAENELSAGVFDYAISNFASYQQDHNYMIPDDEKDQKETIDKLSNDVKTKDNDIPVRN